MKNERLINPFEFAFDHYIRIIDFVIGARLCFFSPKDMLFSSMAYSFDIARDSMFIFQGNLPLVPKYKR